MSKNISLTITSPKYKVLGDYLQDPRSQGFPGELKSDQKKSVKDFDWINYADIFLNYTFKDKTTGEVLSSNTNSILDAFKNYPEIVKKINRLYNNQRSSIKSSESILDIPLKPGIIFTVPLEKISKEALLVQGIKLVSNNEPAFKAKALIDIEKDLGYVKSFEQDEDNVQGGDVKYQFPDMTIWVWCRALNENTNGELNGQIFNVTPFVTNLQTTHTKSGSGFSFTLAPINAELNPETGQWKVKKGSIIQNDNSDYVSVATANEVQTINGKKKIVRNQFLFHNIISTNDLVFIRYETLKLEEKQRLRDNANFIVDKKELANRVYDMIGMVDENTITSQFEANDASVSIRGRDLSKLFIEDGTYFYPYESKQGVLYLQGGSTQKNELTQRIINENSQLYLGLYYNNSIEEILKFVIQQLSTIKVVPNDLFSSYSNEIYKNQQGEVSSNFNSYRPEELQDRRNQQFNSNVFANEENQKKLKANLENRRQELKTKELNIIQAVSDFRKSEYINLNEVSLIKSSVVYDELKEFIKTTMLTFNTEGNQIAKVDPIQNKYFGWKKFVYKNEEIYENVFPQDFLTSNPDLSKSLFNDMTDQPYRMFADASDLIQKIYIQIKEENEFKKADFVQEPLTAAKGIWQIVKLVVDKKVATRLLIDSSISSANGSLMNFLKKACQEPFIEIFFDTYGDQFYIIVRQPPTDKVSMESYLDGKYQDVKNLNESDDTLNKPVIISIKEIDVTSDNLSFSDACIYSWYHFVPQASFISGSEKFSTAFIPAVYFPEYSDIWGSKSLDLIHNYSNYYTQYSKETLSKGMSEANIQVYQDMKYMIDSNMYNPFARKGSITMKNDRRLKVGNPVRYEATGEIYWIDSISRSFSISGTEIASTATLQVSRGLMESFIRGVKGSVLNEYFKDQSIKFTPEKTFSYFDIINTKLNLTPVVVPKKKTITTKVLISKPNQIIPNESDYEDGVILTVDDTRKTISNSVTSMPLESQNGFISVLPNIQNDFEISQLHVSAQPNFRKFLNECEKLGWIPIITSGKRSVEKQRYLKKQNSNNASPETSKHVKGFALDLNFKASKNIAGIRKGTQLIKGANASQQLYWNKKWILSGVPQLAHRLGLIWGGNYRNYKDNVHFELSSNYIVSNTIPTNEPQYRTITKEVPDGTQTIVNPDLVFSNFKVDKEIFNFFLRHQQFGYVQGAAKNKQNSKVKQLSDLPEVSIISQEQLNSISTSEKIKLQDRIISDKNSTK